ncbi:MAG: mandelate racemase/muconate lactonizing enzyme family protein [Gemmatimonadetes bacterium]|jgi:muconate cycloisomerase|nr:mandelate racemase/muconate lactonizing enzyme family protein [Gemmatimonadota bacterium]MBT6148429.1 mandelate racemase/muconate lactonizing enzyme family protein [Gemmatimonadota bacterium]MBT7862825.1 mandelate racemase/muconate lactonizing enzyme family protein [Gemmatimonadota bacterium]
MKIERVEWWQVNQFVHQEMVNSPEYNDTHEQWDLVPKFIVRLTTDDGQYGVGESGRGLGLESVELGARQLIGLDPRTIPVRRLPMEGAGGAYRAYETAFLDLLGRIRQMRMCDLLGGACREEVVGSYWAGLQNPTHSLVAAAAARDGGYSCLKIKIMTGMAVIERLQGMLEIAPDLHFIVDAMSRYDSLDEMRELAKQMADLNVVCLEDPLPKDRYDWYKILREETPIPIALHLGTTEAILKALKAEAADIFNCSPGSAVEFVSMADVVGAAGKTCWHGSGADLGILDLSYIHACAVPEAATVPHDILSTPLHVDDFVVQMPARQGERIQVPQAPGIGAELDMDAVKEYEISSGDVTDRG